MATRSEDVQPTYGIITALEEEYTAVWAMLEHARTERHGDSKMWRTFVVGQVRTEPNEGHVVVLSKLPRMGNNAAAVRATMLQQIFPTIQTIIMVGIAGGAPDPTKAEDDIRLGDVVFCNAYGAIQYDNKKQTLKKVVNRASNFPPDPILLDIADHLKAGQRMGDMPWLKWIERGLSKLEIERPSSSTDILLWPDEQGERVPYIRLTNTRRVDGQPLIFAGKIGSANTLLKDYRTRDKLREIHGFRAIEMEGAGVAEAAWNVRATYFVVRGISDYCDENKNNDYHDYAALTAAAFARVLLESVRGSSLPPPPLDENTSHTDWLPRALSLLRSIARNVKGDVWPDRVDRMRNRLTDLDQAIDQLWGGISRQPRKTPAVKRLLEDQIVLKPKMHDHIVRLDMLFQEFRPVCRANTVTAARLRDKISQELRELETMLDSFSRL
jgi:Nucleoside phosphorylase